LPVHSLTSLNLITLWSLSRTVSRHCTSPARKIE